MTPAGTNIERHLRLDSTNRYAVDAARRGAADGLVVVAGEQTAGRGRRDRRFVSPPGGALLCSFLCRPGLSANDLHLVPSALGLAALDAIATTTGLQAALKWPNDVVVGAGEAKVAGLIAEVVADLSGDAVVVGIGVNVAWPPGWPAPASDEAELVAGATTLQAESGRPVTVEALLDALIAAFARRRVALATPAGRRELAADYHRAVATIGRRVRLELDARNVTGLARDIDASGRLVIEHDGRREHFEVGDVVHLREQAGD